MSRRKFLDNLKRATAYDSCRKSSVMKLFNEIARMNSRPATPVTKNPPPRMFTCEYIRTFRASTERPCMSSAFFDKIQGCVLKGCSFIKTLVH